MSLVMFRWAIFYWTLWACIFRFWFSTDYTFIWPFLIVIITRKECKLALFIIFWVLNLAGLDFLYERTVLKDSSILLLKVDSWLGLLDEFNRFFVGFISFSFVSLNDVHSIIILIKINPFLNWNSFDAK